RWNAVARKGSARAGVGVVDDGAGSVEIARAQRVVRNGAIRSRCLAACSALPIGEEKQLVSLNRTANHGAKLILEILRRAVRVAGARIQAIKIVTCFDGAVGVELPGRAVKIVGAGLDRDVHG